MYCIKLSTSIACVLEVTAIMLCQACRYQVSSIMYNSYELMVLLYVTGDIDPAIRQEVWRFLYGLYPANSTHRWAVSGWIMHLTECTVILYGNGLQILQLV